MARLVRFAELASSACCTSSSVFESCGKVRSAGRESAGCVIDWAHERRGGLVPAWASTVSDRWRGPARGADEGSQKQDLRIFQHDPSERDPEELHGTG